MKDIELADKTCIPCKDNTQLLDLHRAQTLLGALKDDWRIAEDGKSVSLRNVFKGFAKAVYLSNLCVWLADQEGHHPDIAFGWGYCEITLTTHDLGGLSENDFIWAAKLDKLVSGA